MSLLNRIFWKSISKKERKLVLSFVSEPNRQVLDKILSNNLKYPSAFDNRKFIYIHIPKVAGISIANALGITEEHKWHVPLTYYQAALNKKEFDSYFKFSFVRNPWDRAFSAYKFLYNGGLSQRDEEITTMIRSYRSYEDFITRWLSPETCRILLHFAPMSDFLMTKHGNVSMDFIGRFESLEQDYNTLSQKLRYGESLPHKNSSPDKIKYKDIYTPKMIDKIATVYARDLLEFGYTYE